MKLIMSQRVMVVLAILLLAGQVGAVAVWTGGNAGNGFGLRGLGFDGTPVFGLAPPGAELVRSIEQGPSGNVYVSDLGTKTVSKYDAQGNLLDAEWIPSTALPVGANTNGQNAGADWGPDGNYYQLMDQDMEVRVFNASGGAPINTIDLTAGGTLFPGATVDLEFDANGKFYVTDINNGRIYRYFSNGAPDGILTSSVSGPAGMAFGPDGNLYFASAGANNRIYKVLISDGTTTPFTTAGTAIRYPEFDPTDGSLWVTDFTTQQLLRWNGASFDVKINDPLAGGSPFALLLLPEPGTLGLMMVGGYMLLRRGRLRIF